MNIQKIAIVGCGVVGASWAVIYARAGKDVTLFDAQPEALERARASIAARLADVDGKVGTISATTSLAEAVRGSDYVQESAPERLPLKQQLYRELDELISDRQIIGSSTSGFPASAFTEGLRHRGRCLVVHPVNPPHLVPLVELIPAPWTEPAVLEAARALMDEIGQSPITLTREINGFVINRLQSAVLGEAFRLVEDGICSVEDVDKAMRDGLGLRWFFMGPFETIDLNARLGVAEYVRNLGEMYHGLAKEQADPRQWGADLVETVEAERRKLLPEAEIAARQRWRDDKLAQLVKAKAEIFSS